MKETFLATLSPMLVMFLCILVGFVLRKSKVAPENTATVLSKLEINVLLPALNLKTFLTYCTVESIAARWQTVLYGAVAVTLSLAMAIPLAKLFTKDKNEVKIYRYSLLFANFGFLGNAIVPAIMGDAIMYDYMLFTIPMNIVLYAWAFNSLIPEGMGEKKSVWKSLLNPTSIAMTIGIVLGLLGVGPKLPGFITTTLGNLSNCMGPLAMVLTGFVIGGYHLPGLLKDKKVYIVTILRLIVLPAIILGVLWLLGAQTNVIFMALFAYSAALGLNTVVVPAAYDGDTHTGAGMAVISNAGAVITIPLLYALLTQLLGGIR
jgi:predicted permease